MHSSRPHGWREGERNEAPWAKTASGTQGGFRENPQIPSAIRGPKDLPRPTAAQVGRCWPNRLRPNFVDLGPNLEVNSGGHLEVDRGVARERRQVRSEGRPELRSGMDAPRWKLDGSWQRARATERCGTGTALVIHGYCMGAALALCWYCNALHWCCTGTTQIALVPPWYCTGTARVLHPDGAGSAQVLYWHSDRTTLAPATLAL